MHHPAGSPRPAARGTTNLRFSLHYAMLFTMMATVFPYTQRFLRARGFGDAEVGYLQGILALAGVLGPIVLGHLADRFGRRRLALLACVAVFAVVVVPMNVVAGFWLMAALCVCRGMCSKATIPLSDTLASCELADPTHAYGRVRVWGSVGFVATLLAIRLGGLVDETSSTSMTIAMLIAAALCLASSATLPDHHRAKPTVAGRRPVRSGDGFDKAFWLFLVVAGLQQFGMSGYYYFFTNYLADVVGMPQGAWVWSIGAAAEIPFLFAGGLIIRRFGIPAMLASSLAAVSVRLCVYATVPVLGVILPAQLLHALTFGVFHAASIEFLRRTAPPERRGMAMALYASLSIGVSHWAGASLGGVLVERLGYRGMFLLYALAPLVGVFAVLAGNRLLRRAQTRPDASAVTTDGSGPVD